MNNHASHQQHPENCAPESSSSIWLKRAAIGTTLVAGAVVLSPYLMPLLGVGETALAEEAMTAMHGTGLGNGLAGALNGLINEIPFIGSTLAQGGLITAATSATIGIGGMLLGKYIDKHQDGSSSIRWGKVLSTAALATSALIALPSLLTSISVGVVYLAAAFSGVELASSAVATMAATLGSVGSMSSGMTGLAGAAAALPHMLTCVAPAVPGMLSLGMLSSDSSSYANMLSSELPDGSFSDGKLNIRVKPDAPMEAGKPCHVRLTITHSDTGKPLTPEEMKVVHTEKIHYFVVDESLRDYHHIHPQPTSTPGEYDFTFTPKSPYKYNAWADIVLQSDQLERRVQTNIPCETTRGSSAYIVPCSDVSHDGIRCQWSANPPLQQGKSSEVKITLSDASGKPITDLEQVMGAFVHLVGFSPDSKTMVHTHPVEKDPTDPNERGGPTFHFHMDPEVNGPVQFYVQVQRNGAESYIPVGQVIKPPALVAQKVIAQQQQSSQHGHYASH